MTKKITMSSKNRYRKLKLASAVSLACAMPNIAGAAVLEEIFVTAQKQDQRIMEIPLSVSAVTGEKINDAGINNLEAMSGYVPGLHIGKGPVNTTINIRGIGSGLNRGFEQSVGMYIDGVYMGRSRQFRSPFLDPQRVEVLRGPQGILFGKNTIAGAINIISADPVVDGEAEGSISAKVEPEDGTYEATGIYSTSLSDTVGARIALKHRESDGFVDNTYLDQDEPEVEETTARITVLWEPNDNFSLNTKVSYSDYVTKGSSQVPTKLALESGPFLGGSSILAYTFTNALVPDFEIKPHQTYRDDPAAWASVNGASALAEGTDTQTENVVITAVYEMDSGLTFHSVTGYSGYDQEDGVDADFLPIRFLWRDDNAEFDQISQEFRFTFLEGGPIEFIAGIYLEEQELDMSGRVIFDGTFGGLVPAGLGGTAFNLAALNPALTGSVDVIARNGEVYQESETYAAFGEVTWYITDDLRLTVGGRYSDESKEMDKLQYLSNSNSTGGIASESTCVPTSPTVFDSACASALIMNALVGTNAHDVKGERSNEFFDPSVKVQYNFDYDTMVYIGYSEGHKAGGFNASDDLAIINYNTPTDAFEYDEETAKSIEAGWKGLLADGALQLGVSVFMTEYEDLQVSTFQGASFAVGNAAKADLSGVEIEARYAATDNLEIGGSFAYLDFEFDEYDTAGCVVAEIVAVGPTCTQDLSGERNAFAPEYSGNVFADYSRDVFGGLELKVTVDVNFKSEMHLDSDLDDNTLQAGYGKINTRIALTDESWEVAIYGRNLSDKTTYTTMNDTPLVSGSFSAWADEGETYGAEAKYMF